MYLSSARSQNKMISIDLLSNLRIVLVGGWFQRTCWRSVSSPGVNLSTESHLASAATLHLVSATEQNHQRVLMPCSENWPKLWIATPDGWFPFLCSSLKSFSALVTTDLHGHCARLKGSTKVGLLHSICTCKGVRKLDMEETGGINATRAASSAIVEAVGIAQDSWVEGCCSLSLPWLLVCLASFFSSSTTTSSSEDSVLMHAELPTS